MIRSIRIIIFSILLFNYEIQELNADSPSIESKVKPPVINKSKKAQLYNSAQCHDNIVKYCPRSRQTELTDMSVMQCIYNEIKDLSVLDVECQHLIYSYKLNLTKVLKLDPTAESICKDDLLNIKECNNVEDTNGHLVSCLIEKIEVIKNEKCKTFLNNVAVFMFTDYRLISNFQQKCADDISSLQCGRLDTADNAPTDQGKTIACLSKEFKKLKEECRKEIFRIAEFQSEDFHLDRALYFACKDDREKFCEKIVSGKGNVYNCLMKNKFDQEMSKDCQQELTRRQKLIVEDVNVDKGFINACKKDILQYECRGALRTGESGNNKLANVLLCLETASKDGKSIEPDCRTEMVEHRRMLMSDYSLNPELVDACKNEISSFCNNGEEKGGKTLHCLFRNAKNLKNKETFGSECITQLRKLIKVADAGEDVRVDTHLKISCQAVIKGACKDVQPGGGRVLECLMRNIGTNDMNEDCEERLLEAQFFVARDWKLNPNLFKVCKDDAISICNAKSNWHETGYNVDEGPLVLPCLYHHIDDETKKVSLACASEVKRVMQIRAKSIDLMPDIQEACASDLSSKCSSADRTKKGEEMRCLQEKFDDLSDDCKDAIEKYTEDESKDIQLDQILVKSCMPIINEFCADEKDSGKGDLLECLIKQKNNPKLETKCRSGIEHHQLVNLKNIKFNYKIKTECEKNVQTYCSDSKDKISIVQCLSSFVLNDTLLDRTQRIDEKCRAQLKFEFLQMNEDIRLDPLLLKACMQDISQNCANIQPGRAQILECLKKNMNMLSKECADKLSVRKTLDLIDEGVDYKLKEKCKTSIMKYCQKDGNSDLLACLRKQLLQPDVDTECRQIVVNRIMTQNKDIRLNPTLWNACKLDAGKYCQVEVNGVENGEELNGLVIKCLKSQFVNNKLTRDCGLEIEQIMREAANIDYRLDPILTEACFKEIHGMCSEDADDKKEDCLRLKFQQKKIDPNEKCFGEVRRIISEGAADIFTDPELHEACSTDINRICYDVPIGAAKQLKCLLDAEKSQRVKLLPKCSQLLTKRRELWNLADVSNELTGLKDLYYTIQKSSNRYYIIGVLIAIVFIVFLLGCKIRPTLSRASYRFQKLK